MTAHAFDEAVALEPAGENRWTGHTHPAWANMVGPFGGITAAQGLAAVLLDARRLGEPVSFTVNFAAALAEGEFTVTARPARTNRSTQHWVIEMTQGEGTVLTATAFTAIRRQTWSAGEHEMPRVPGAEDTPRPTQRPPVGWVQRYDMRFVEGSLPSVWDGQDLGQSLSRQWVRDEPPRALDYLSLTAMCDVFFPRVWRRRPVRVPIGTVSMTVYYHCDGERLARTGSSHLLGQARAQAFHNGYFDQTAQMWNPGGELLATSHQIVYYKE